MLPDADAVTSLLRRAAAEAILPRFKRLARHEIREKAPGDLVTVADTDAERLLTAQLRELAPGSVVIGEEAAAADPEILRRFAGAAWVWVIDPVDGTANFTNGNPNFAIIVALVEIGTVRAGWIHLPTENTTYWAIGGEGTWRDGTRLHVRPAPPVARMTGMVSGVLPGRGRARRIFDASGSVGRTVNIGCTGRTYTELIEGRFHYAFFGRSMPWDHAAGSLLYREAGGYGAFLDGQAYTPLRADHPLLVAPDRASWGRLREILHGGSRASNARD